MWERIGTVTELLMPTHVCERVAKAVSVVTGTGGQGRAGQAFVLLLQLLATAATGNKLQASWHYYLLPSTDD